MPSPFLVLLAGAVLGLASVNAQVIPPGETPHRLVGGLSFGEGPASDTAGNVYFTDQPNDRILRWGLDGRLSTFLQPAGRSNGLCFDAHGDLWACADEFNALWKITPSGTVEKVVTNFEGQLLNGPNDLWIRPDGGIYFTDPLYPRPYWKRDPAAQNPRGVYFLSPDRKHLSRVAEDFRQPNGIIGTPDGRTLYVADHEGRKTYRFDIATDGSLHNRTLFCEQGSDGMTIDRRGNVYLTFDGVTVYSPEGKRIGQIDLPSPNRPTNVCFGGPDHRTLFITVPDALYAIPSLVGGGGSQ
jgi:gluconolactonase